MRSREQQWSDQHDTYRAGTRMLLPHQLNDEYAAVCLLLRDAPWAAGLFPTSSLGRLGITASPIYEEWIVGRSAWLGANAEGQLSVTYQENSGRTRATRNVASFGANVLQDVASWLRGEVEHDG
jgi:hypothetical protein